MRTFELLLSFECNAKCGFCYNPPVTPELLRQRLPFKRAAELLQRARADGYGGVWFTGGDPTLRPDLQKLLLLSRKLGFTRIQIGTNGVRLAAREEAERLAEAGLNYVRLSLHAASAPLHDELLKLPGAFDAALAAYGHLRRRGVYVGVNFVVTRRNYRELPAFYELCSRLEVPDLDVIFMHYQGMMEADADGLAVRYAEAAPYLEGCRVPLTIINAPPCVVPAALRSSVSDWSVESTGDALRVPTTETLDLRDMKESQRAKGPGCARCSLEPRCLGFERRYAARFGDKEFVPC